MGFTVNMEEYFINFILENIILFLAISVESVYIDMFVFMFMCMHYAHCIPTI